MSMTPDPAAYATSAAPPPRPARNGARTLAVTSGKGGVGKTFVTANLAAALAARGQRVLVLDADLGLANLDVVLNLHPKLTLHDVFTEKATLEQGLQRAAGRLGHGRVFAPDAGEEPRAPWCIDDARRPPLTRRVSRQ